MTNLTKMLETPLLYLRDTSWGPLCQTSWMHLKNHIQEILDLSIFRIKSHWKTNHQVYLKFLSKIRVSSKTQENDLKNKFKSRKVKMTNKWDSMNKMTKKSLRMSSYQLTLVTRMWEESRKWLREFLIQSVKAKQLLRNLPNQGYVAARDLRTKSTFKTLRMLMNFHCLMKRSKMFIKHSNSDIIISTMKSSKPWLNKDSYPKENARTSTSKLLFEKFVNSSWLTSRRRPGTSKKRKNSVNLRTLTYTQTASPISYKRLSQPILRVTILMILSRSSDLLLVLSSTIETCHSMTTRKRIALW